MDIGNRLREERERLGLSQTQFGVLGGSGKTTVLAWERGTAYPNAAFLAAVAAAGVDVAYVVTGHRDGPAPEHLSGEERLLLDYFRQAEPAVRKAAIGALVGASAGASQNLSGNVFHGNVGNVAGRNVIVKSNKK